MSASLKLFENHPIRLLARAMHSVLSRKGIDETLQNIERMISPTPSVELGDYGVPLLRLLKRVEEKITPKEVFVDIENKLKNLGLRVIKEARLHGAYLNVVVNEEVLAKLVFDAVRNDGSEFGIVKTDNPQRIVVEHTSANPVHPLHIGHARNASLGDTLARLLRARGHIVQTRFYINDVGRQVAVLAYGIIKAGLSIPKNVKKDHWIGLVYAITHTLVDISVLKKELETLKKEGRYEEYRDKLSELDRLVAILSKLREKNSELFDKLASAINNDPDPESSISEIMKAYEYKLDEVVVRRIREIVNACLEGFKETLSRFGVEFDVWDWESDLVWNSDVRRVIDVAKKTPYFTLYKGTYALDFKRILGNEEVRNALGISEGTEIPPLILMRSDGTTLYTTRDIAYSIKKFREFNADKVINVVAAEQRLEQLQVRLALIALGYHREGYNLLHYDYEMVNLPGVSMSGRRGEYVSLDELLDRAAAIARREVEQRSSGGHELDRIAEAVGVGAVRFSLVSVAAQKPLVFNMNEALDFDRNSAPYIQYTYARAHNILAKYGKPIDWSSIDYYSGSKEGMRRKLILLLSEFPRVFVKAADELRPELLVSYVLKLADTFNAWYPRDHVIREQDPGLRNFKLALVYATKQVLRNIMKILGVPVLERM